MGCGIHKGVPISAKKTDNMNTSESPSPSHIKKSDGGFLPPLIQSHHYFYFFHIQNFLF